MALRRILIANRGEIAVRIARTVGDLGREAVAVHGASDADALHVRSAASAVALPGAGAAAYVDVAGLVAAALGAGCDAVHPGYGFLSEDAGFASAVEAARLVFIGPTPAQLAGFGDKLSARAIAMACGVPVAAATGVLEDAAAARTALGDGPLMLKAAHGGGGRGLRVVRPGDDIAAAFAAATAEAMAAFGQPAVYAERLVEHARHIEVQLAGDGEACVVLGLRDCSLQRRRQKMLEIAPPPGLDTGVAARLAEAALALGRHVGLRNLATVEFLVAGTDIHFIEANPRLQVEHTVTEAVTGIDLVALQIALAEGRTLGALGLERMPATRGHALQLRIAATGLLPITRFDVPGGPGVRCDSGVAVGDTPDAAFDPLLAKLIVHAEGGIDDLLRKARRVAGEVRIEGPATTLPLLRRLLERDELAAGTTDTGFVDGLAADAAVAGEAGLIVAPIGGLVAALDVAVGDVVAAGAQLMLVEAMKMQHEVVAPGAGRVVAVLASVGEVVAEGAPLLKLVAVDGSAAGPVHAVVPDLDAIRPDLAALRERLAMGFDAARPQAAAKRAALGLRTARANVDDLLDPGSFNEYGALAVAAQRRRRDEAELIRATPGDGMVAGFGTVGGASVAVLAYDYSVLAGTQGWFNHKKTDRVLDVAARNRNPVVFFTEGGGGRPGDVDADLVSVTGLDVTSFAHWAAMNGRAPRIAVNAGRCFAGNAVIFGLADITVATRGSNIGLGGPAMIEGGGLGRFAPEAIGPAPLLADKGAVDLLVADEAGGVAAARALLGYFAGPVPVWDCADQRLLRQAIPENRLRIHDMHALAATLADTGSVTELRAGYGREMITALVRIEGRPFGLIANDPRHLGGAIGSEGAEKAARFLQLCDAYGLPIVSLVDTPGFMVGPASEATAAVRRGSRLIAAGANLAVPFFAVVVRRGFGLGAQAMAAGSFRQAGATIAWPGAEFGAMGIEGAVRLGFAKELDAAPDRAALEAKLVAAMRARGQAASVAAHLEIDAVIDPAETRAWLLRALHAAGEVRRGRGFVDVW